METVGKYYKLVASDYANKFSHGPLGWLRTCESKALLKTIPDIIDKNVLELGCGTGYYTKQLIEFAPKSITAVDLEQSMLDNLPDDSRIIPVCSDVNSLELKTKFDFILSAGMLEFVSSPSQVLALADSLIAPDGKFVVLVPTRTISGFLYKMYHKRNGIKINLFEINKFKLTAKHTGWHVESYKTCGLFSMVIVLQNLS